MHNCSLSGGGRTGRRADDGDRTGLLVRGAQDRLPTDHAPPARRLPVLDQPPLDRARAARPDREGDPGDGGCRHHRHPAGLGLALRPPARAVRRHRHPGGGEVPLALLLGLLTAQARRPDHRDHRARDARGVPVHPPGQRPRARHDHPAGRAQRRLRAARPAAGEDAVPGGGQRRDAGDGDAAHARPSRHDARRRPVVQLTHAGADDLPRRAARVRRAARRADPARAAHRHRRHARDERPRRGLPRLARARDLGLRSRADARRVRGALGRRRSRGRAAPRAVHPRPRW